MTTAADGTFTISGLPTESDLVLTLRKDGYSPSLLAIETSTTDMNGLNAGGGPILIGDTSVTPVVPTTVDWMNKGQVIFVAVVVGPSGKATDLSGDLGAKVSLSPVSGNGPYFLNADNAIDPSATSMIDKVGIYFNIDPGAYQLTFDDPIHDCAPLSSIFGGYGFAAPPTSVKFPIVAGYVTLPVGVYCTAKSVIVNTGDAN